LDAQQETSSSDPDMANFAVAQESVGTVAVVSVSGAVDMLTAPQLSQAIADSLSRQPTAVIVDLLDVDFLASAGMQVIVAAHEDAGSQTKLVVVADGPATSRPLKITGIADFIGVYPTRDDALQEVQV
jgi:anti-anti-sigma factor